MKRIILFITVNFDKKIRASKGVFECGKAMHVSNKIVAYSSSDPSPVPKGYLASPCFVDAGPGYMDAVKKKYPNRGYLDAYALYNEAHKERLYSGEELILFLSAEDVNSGLNELLQSGKWEGQKLSDGVTIVIVGSLKNSKLSRDIFSRICYLHRDELSAQFPPEESSTVSLDPEPDYSSQELTDWESLTEVSSPEDLASCDFQNAQLCYEGLYTEQKIIIVDNIDDYIDLKANYPNATYVKTSLACIPVSAEKRQGERESDIDGVYLYSSCADYELQINAACSGDLKTLSSKVVYLPERLEADLYQRVRLTDHGWQLQVDRQWIDVAGVKWYSLGPESFCFRVKPYSFSPPIEKDKGLRFIIKEFERLEDQGVFSKRYYEYGGHTCVGKLLDKINDFVLSSPAHPFFIIRGGPGLGKDFLTGHILRLYQQLDPGRIAMAHITASYESSAIQTLLELRQMHPEKRLLLIISELNLFSEEDLQELAKFLELDGNIQVIGTQNSDSDCSGRFSIPLSKFQEFEFLVDKDDMVEMLDRYIEHNYTEYKHLIPENYTRQSVSFYFDWVNSTVWYKLYVAGFKNLIKSTFRQVLHATDLYIKYEVIERGGRSPIWAFETAFACYNIPDLSGGVFEYFEDLLNKRVGNPQLAGSMGNFTYRVTPNSERNISNWKSSPEAYRIFLCPQSHHFVSSDNAAQHESQASTETVEATIEYLDTSEKVSLLGVPTFEPSRITILDIRTGEVLDRFDGEDERAAKPFSFDRPCLIRINSSRPLDFFSNAMYKEGVALSSYTSARNPDGPFLNDKQEAVLKQILKLKGLSFDPITRESVLKLFGLPSDSDDGRLLDGVYRYFNLYMDIAFEQMPFCDLLDGDDEAQYQVWSFINQAGVCRHQGALVEILLKACGIDVEVVVNVSHVFAVVTLPTGQPVIFDLRHFRGDRIRVGKQVRGFSRHMEALPESLKSTDFYKQWQFYQGYLMNRYAEECEELHLFWAENVERHQKLWKAYIKLESDPLLARLKGVFWHYLTIGPILKNDENYNAHMWILDRMQKMMQVIDYEEKLRSLDGPSPLTEDRESIVAKLTTQGFDIESFLTHLKGLYETAMLQKRQSKAVKRQDAIVITAPAPTSRTENNAFKENGQKIYRALKACPDKLQGYLNKAELNSEKEWINGIGLWIMGQFPLTYTKKLRIVPEGQLKARAASMFVGADGRKYAKVRSITPKIDSKVTAIRHWITSDKKAMVLTTQGLKLGTALDGTETFPQIGPRTIDGLNAMFKANKLPTLVSEKRLTLAIPQGQMFETQA